MQRHEDVDAVRNNTHTHTQGYSHSHIQRNKGLEMWKVSELPCSTSTLTVKQRRARDKWERARERQRGEGECLLSSSEAFVKWEIREEERLISPLLSPCWELNGGSVSLYSCARPEVSKWSSSVKTGKDIIITMHHIIQESGQEASRQCNVPAIL